MLAGALSYALAQIVTRSPRSAQLFGTRRSRGSISGRPPGHPPRPAWVTKWPAVDPSYVTAEARRAASFKVDGTDARRRCGCPSAPTRASGVVARVGDAVSAVAETPSSVSVHRGSSPQAAQAKFDRDGRTNDHWRRKRIRPADGGVQANWTSIVPLYAPGPRERLHLRWRRCG